MSFNSAAKEHFCKLLWPSQTTSLHFQLPNCKVLAIVIYLLQVAVDVKLNEWIHIQLLQYCLVCSLYSANVSQLWKADVTVNITASFLEGGWWDLSSNMQPILANEIIIKLTPLLYVHLGRYYVKQNCQYAFAWFHLWSYIMSNNKTFRLNPILRPDWGTERFK